MSSTWKYFVYIPVLGIDQYKERSHKLAVSTSEELATTHKEMDQRCLTGVDKKDKLKSFEIEPT